MRQATVQSMEKSFAAYQLQQDRKKTEKRFLDDMRQRHGDTAPKNVVNTYVLRKGKSVFRFSELESGEMMVTMRTPAGPIENIISKEDARGRWASLLNRGYEWRK